MNLFVSSYDGTVTTLSLGGAGSDYTLRTVSKAQGCGSNPSWLVYEKPNRVLYCMDENMDSPLEDPSAIFTSYNIDASGTVSPQKSDNLTTTAAVSGVLFNDNKHMAIAHYFGRISVLTIDETSFKQVQVLTSSTRLS